MVRRILTLLLASAAVAAAQSYTIKTVAGGGPLLGAAAINVQPQSPSGTAVDSAGNVYVAAAGQNQVLVFDSNGVLAQIIGTGTAGFSGDGGAASAAQLSSPTGVAVDSAGNVYIADRYNSRIRKVSVATGIINTVAGNGVTSSGYSYYCPVYYYCYSYSYYYSYGDGGAATSAAIPLPVSVAVDSAGNLFVSEADYHVRKVTAAGIISTYAGFGDSSNGGFSGDGGAATSAKLNNPQGLAVDSGGNLYIADQYNARIRKVTASTGIITTVAGNGNYDFSGDGGAATNASLSTSPSVAVDGAGNLYIADQSNERIRKVTVSTGIITTVAGNGANGFSGDGGTATNVSLSPPSSVAVDGAGNLYIADPNNSRVRKVVALTNIITTFAGNSPGDGGAATGATLNNPTGVAVDNAGNLYVADQSNHRIRKTAASTGIISTVAGNGSAGFSGDNGAATGATLNNPTGVAVDNAGNLYVADQSNHRIRKTAASTGIISTVAGNGSAGFGGDGGAATGASLYYPTGVAVDSAGDVYIADQNNSRIRKVAASTGIITTLAGNGSNGFAGDGGAATSASLVYPSGVTVDSAGNLYIADLYSQRIRKVAAETGIITTVAGNGSQQGFGGDGGAATSASLYNPYGVTVDSAGNLYIADLYSQRIRKVAAETGIITTVVGNGDYGFSGDGGPATSAALASPYGVAVDAAGNLYIADYGNKRIREASLPGTTIALSSNANPSAAQTLILTATINPSTATGSVTFKDGAVSVGVASVSGGVATLSSPSLTPGLHSLTAIYGGDATYPGSTSAVLSQTITNPATTTTLESSNASATYGQQVTVTATVIPSGATGTVQFKDGSANLGSTVALLAGVATLSTSTLPAGSHSITAIYNGDPTYSASTSPALAQSVAPVSLSIIVDNKSRNYGDANPVLTGTITGVLNSDPITVTYSTTAILSSTVGTYAVTATLSDGGSGALSNYSVTNTPGTLTVGAAGLTVAADNNSRLYGDANPAFTGTITGIKNSDPISAAYGTSATATSNAGGYAITASLSDAGSGALANYTVTNTPGTLQVNPAPLTIAANDASRPYGDANPAFTSSLTGAKNGDTFTVTYSTAATPASPIGTYAIVPSASNANYTVTLQNGTLTVTLAPLVVTPADATRMYGQTNPLLTGAVTGIRNSDPVTGTYSTAAVQTTPIGNYIITATLLDPNHLLSNYSVTLKTGTLSITKAAIAVTAAGASRVYLAAIAPPALAGTLSGVTAGDNITAAYTTSAAAGSPFGNYAIVPSLSDPNNRLGNYNVTSANGVLAITPLALTASVTIAQTQYSDVVTTNVTVPNPGPDVPAASVSIMAGGVQLGPITLTPITLAAGGPTLSGTAVTAGGITLAPGTYPATVIFSPANANYTISLASAPSLVVAPEDARATYTGALFASTASATSTTSTVTLSATVQDITAVLADAAYDALPGNITKATITFVNRDTGADIATVPIGVVNAADTKTGTAIYNWSVNIGCSSSPCSGTFTVGFRVNGYYTRNSSLEDVIVNVAQPGTNFITGGGYLSLTNSSGIEAGDRGSKNNFGFNVKYNKSGTNLQGNINVIIRRTESDGAVHTYQVKGNVMTSLSVNASKSPATGVFNGKASIQDITNPNAPVSVDGNAALQINLSDYGTAGADTIAITVWNKAGGMWFSSDWNGTQTIQQALAGGNLSAN